MHHKYGLSTTPAYKDGIVFATFGNELYAFDADIRDKKDEGIRDEPQGRDRHDILWKAELKGSICRSSPLFYREMVLLNTVAGVEFYPVRPKKGSGTGRIKIYETGGTLSAGMAHNGSILVAASRSGHVAYDLKTDRKLWTAGAGLGTSPCIDGGFVYFADAAGRLQCVRIADGKPAWKSESRFRVGTYASPSTDKGIVYATGGRDGTLHAIDGGTGKTDWTFEVPAEDELKRGVKAGYGRSVYCKPLVCDGKIYFTSYSGYLYCVKEGRLLWKERISESICMTIPMAYKGAIYVRGKGATYKFGSRR